VFSNIPIFDGLSDVELNSLKSCVKERSYPKNSLVINEGDDSNSLYIILQGGVNVFLSNEAGKEIVLNTLGKGDYFGELAMIANRPRSSSVITNTPSTFAVMTQSMFEEILKEHQNIQTVLLRNLANRVIELSESVRSLALLDVYGRIVKVLMDLAEREGDFFVINHKITQQEIANRVGSSREMVTRILKDLSIGGFISTSKDQLKILKKLPDAY
jgi:CRP/FNR family cyclic AMP-dependent transcriptional regulator